MARVLGDINTARTQRDSHVLGVPLAFTENHSQISQIHLEA